MGAGLAWQWLAIPSVQSVTEGGVSILDFPGALYLTMFNIWINSDFIYNTPKMVSEGTIGMPSLAITIINFLVAMYVFVGYSDTKRDGVRTRGSVVLPLVMCVLALAVVAGSFAAMYIGASYLQDEGMGIRGVQTRYFIPAFILISMAPFIRKFHASESTFRTVTIYGSVFVLVAQTLMLLHIHHWV